ncbi:MAG: HlyC/CorC family transporter [candidate division Zixibacteria bacterium]|nr:HlyC/CorC family transporter [candidate division Zixibacteria bacterium]
MKRYIKRIISGFKQKFLGIEDESATAKRDIEEEMLETLERASTDGSIDLEKDEREMIHSIFELGDTTVREIMVPRIDMKYIKEEHSFSDIQEIVKETGHSRLPLIADDIDNIIGIVFVKDLFLNMEDVISGKLKLRDFIRKPLIVPEGKKVDELLRDMIRQKSHLAVVIDEYGGTSGLVTMEDIFEEIVGEIEDEYDTEMPEVVETEPGQYVVNANLSIEELNEQIGAGLPAEEFETVGGLIYDLVGSLPTQGQKVLKGNLTFIVESVEGQRIMSVKVIMEEK